MVSCLHPPPPQNKFGTDLIILFIFKDGPWLLTEKKKRRWKPIEMSEIRIFIDSNQPPPLLSHQFIVCLMNALFVGVVVAAFKIVVIFFFL